ncbi:MAG TPA: SPOR domain-containing protein [Candidatus Acidoferrum sp.]|nr:SPOR domain-containing protein [Candidatus Acidoferrum sp.]
MAGGGRRGGGERVLESRHLVGLFLGVVLLCGVFFTLGYVMGRTQFNGAVHAEDQSLRSARPAVEPTPKPAADDADNPPASAGNEWDFAKKDNNHLEPAPALSVPPATNSRKEPAASVRPVSEASRPPAKFRSPLIPKGSIVLQLAALKSEGDALALADAVQQKRFPSFVVTPTSDSLYRVQVGPYTNEKSADAAKQALAKAGFNAIIKR